MHTEFVYTAITEQVKVSVRPSYDSTNSIPAKFQYHWIYNVSITNLNEFAIKILGRNWILTNAQGKKEEIFGPGVVGEEPIINPQKSFDYSSFAILSTSSGFMEGWYHAIVPEKDRSFKIKIPLFSLDFPHYGNLC